MSSRDVWGFLSSGRAVWNSFIIRALSDALLSVFRHSELCTESDLALQWPWRFSLWPCLFVFVPNFPEIHYTLILLKIIRLLVSRERQGAQCWYYHSRQQVLNLTQTNHGRQTQPCVSGSLCTIPTIILCVGPIHVRCYGGCHGAGVTWPLVRSRDTLYMQLRMWVLGRSGVYYYLALCLHCTVYTPFTVPIHFWL